MLLDVKHKNRILKNNILFDRMESVWFISTLISMFALLFLVINPYFFQSPSITNNHKIVIYFIYAFSYFPLSLFFFKFTLKTFFNIERYRERFFYNESVFFNLPNKTIIGKVTKQDPNQKGHYLIDDVHSVHENDLKSMYMTKNDDMSNLDFLHEMES